MNQRLRNNVPALLRFFSTEEHAEQFLSGSIRVGLLSHYGSCENERTRDATEGIGSIRAPSNQVTTIEIDADELRLTTIEQSAGHMNYTTQVGNPAYILCCSDAQAADIEKLKSRFNCPYVVRIENPKKLLKDIKCALSRQGNFALSGTVVQLKRVRYDFGLDQDQQFGAKERFENALIQKPLSFSIEHEYRFLLMLKSTKQAQGNLDQHILLELDSRIDDASLL